MIERWARYAAIGDSYSEGLWDMRDGDPEDLRGWTDRLAESISRRRTQAGLEPIRYANLALRGRPLRRILDEQFDRALAMAPDLLSIVGGGIDIMRIGADPDALAVRLERAVVTARAAGSDVLLSTCMDTRAGGPLLHAIRPKMALYSAHICSIARRHGCYVLDQWGLRALADLRMWAPDRTHLSTEGHHRLSQAALVGLGLEPDDPEWQRPLPPLPPNTRRDQAREYGDWLRRDVAPWIGRGIRRVSTGDGRSPKRPRMEPIAAPDE